jgi:hypothetical protein
MAGTALEWSSQGLEEPFRMAAEHRLVTEVLSDLAVVELADLDVREGEIIVEPNATVR